MVILSLVQRSNPIFDLENDVKQWHVDITCWPSWEAILEIEYVRKFCNINMFTDDVQSICSKLKLYNGAEWYSRLKMAGVLPSQIFGVAVRFYERAHGSQDSWLASEMQIGELLGMKYEPK